MPIYGQSRSWYSNRPPLARADVVPGSSPYRKSHNFKRMYNSTMGCSRSVLQRAAQARWVASGSTAAQCLLGNTVGAGTAARLLGANLAPLTQSSYQGHWERFERYCKDAGLRALPAEPKTIVCYLGVLFEEGRVAGGSLRPYVAAVGSHHRRCGFSDPTATPIVRSARQGYRSMDASRRRGPPSRSAPFPAELAEQALKNCITATRAQDIQLWGLVTVGFLICARPTSVRNIRRK